MRWASWRSVFHCAGVSGCGRCAAAARVVALWGAGGELKLGAACGRSVRGAHRCSPRGICCHRCLFRRRGGDRVRAAAPGCRPQVCGIQQLALVATCVPQPGMPLTAGADERARESKSVKAHRFQGNPCAVAAGAKRGPRATRLQPCSCQSLLLRAGRGRDIIGAKSNAWCLSVRRDKPAWRRR